MPLEDTFGELEIQYWLRESGVKRRRPRRPRPRAGAATASPSPRARRVPGASSSTRPGTREADASEFADAANTAIGGLADPARISSPAGTHVTVLVASSEDALLALDVIFGATGV